MQRRTYLASTGVLLASGCIGSSSEEPNSDEIDTPDSTVNDDPIDRDQSTDTRQRERDHYVSGMWMNNIPEEADPYPTDEEPLKSNDLLQDFFDEVASQDEHEGSGDKQNNGEGELVHLEVSADEMEKIVEDLEAVEFIESGFRRGRYVVHDGTYIWVTVETK